MSEQTIDTQSVPDVAKDTYTYDEAIDKLGFGWYQILMLQLCGFGMIVIIYIHIQLKTYSSRELNLPCYHLLFRNS
jgi:hypothetical protein